MPSMNDESSIKQQYAKADGLNIRMKLHQKYSVNPQPYGEWISEHYCIEPGMSVLELGCGTGVMWSEPARWLPASARLLLTDFSAGMLETARNNVPKQPNISFAQVDIQQIPFPDQIFDLVIANAMLYHVPDLSRALGEVARVLKPAGRFICATSGENGIGSWLKQVLGLGEAPRIPFTLQNGGDALSKVFGKVDMHLRDDALAVTNVQDLADYVLSMTSFSFVRSWPYEQLVNMLSAQMKDGAIHIPKEYGLFQCCEPIVTKIFD